jgi:enoyl-CoA hydratase/carnithine racemase
VETLGLRAVVPLCCANDHSFIDRCVLQLRPLRRRLCMAFVQLDHDERGFSTLTLTSPDNRNAFTTEAEVHEFVAALDAVGARHATRALIVTGEGSAFSAGGNIRRMLERSRDASIQPIDERHRYREGIQRLPLAMHALEVPTIAAINGAAVGVGLDLACLCDIRIAADDAQLASSFVKLGLIPGDGGAWLLQRVVGYAAAAELAFTGDAIDASAPLRMGLVSRVVPRSGLLDEARTLAARIARSPGEALRMTKRLMREAGQVSLPTLLEMSAAFQALAHFTDDHRRLVERAVERRPA